MWWLCRIYGDIQRCGGFVGYMVTFRDVVALGDMVAFRDVVAGGIRRCGGFR